MVYNDNHDNDMKEKTTYTTPANGYYSYPSNISYTPTTPIKPKKQNRAAFGIIVVVLAFAVSFAGSYLGRTVGLPQQDGGGVTSSVSSENESNNDSSSAADKGLASVVSTTTGDGGMDVKSVAGIAADTVVEITTEQISTGSRMQQLVMQGAGSGVIISEDGYIITNNHVIDGASKITVTLRDGTQYDAVLVGTDPKTDVAVVKIEAEGLTAAKLGTSSSLEIGEDIVVIGNPLGQLGGTVTNGIISALDREITVDGTTMTLLQTNAAINQGNSGGGMFNSKGELVAIVNAKSSGTGIEGLGFAIPIDTALPIAKDLISYGYVQGRVELGVELIEVSDEITAWMYRVNATGVYISGIVDDSAAAEAGLMAGDRIVSIDGNAVTVASDVTNYLDGKAVGDTVNITISRDGRTGSVDITLRELTRAA